MGGSRDFSLVDYDVVSFSVNDESCYDLDLDQGNSGIPFRQDADDSFPTKTMKKVCSFAIL